MGFSLKSYLNTKETERRKTTATPETNRGGTGSGDGFSLRSYLAGGQRQTGVTQPAKKTATTPKVRATPWTSTSTQNTATKKTATQTTAAAKKTAATAQQDVMTEATRRIQTQRSNGSASTYLSGGGSTAPAIPYAAGLQAKQGESAPAARNTTGKKTKKTVTEQVTAPSWTKYAGMTADELKRQHEAAVKERDEAKKQIGQSKPSGSASTYLSGGGSTTPATPYAAGAQARQGLMSGGSDALARLRRTEQEKQGEVDDLATAYYYRKNEEQFARLGTDAQGKASYEAAKRLSDDLNTVNRALNPPTTYNGLDVQYSADAERLKTKYGASDLRTLRDMLAEQKAQKVKDLTAKGYDYEDMAGYDLMLAQREQAETARDKWQKDAQEHPVASSLLSTVISPLQGVDFLRTSLNTVGKSNADDLGKYVPVNNYDMAFTRMVNTTRGTVSKEIRENTDWELWGQNVAEFLYNVGMSALDSAAQVATFGNASTYLMGLSSAANTQMEIIDRGGSNNQAFWGGLAAGVAECFFERYSVESLLSMDATNVSSLKSMMKTVFNQMGVEASEEMFTEVANIISDTIIMGNKSNRETALKEYQAEGMSREKAEQQVFLDNVKEVTLAGVGGAISGGAMASVRLAPYAAANAYMRNYTDTYTQDTQTQQREAANTSAEFDAETGAESTEAARQWQNTEEGQNTAESARNATSEDVTALTTEFPLTEKMGEAGQAGLSTAIREREAGGGLETRMERDSFVSGYIDLYLAGLNGAETDGEYMTLTAGESAEGLTQAERAKAYFNGQNDAAAAVEHAKLVRNFARVAGSEKGLVYDEYVETQVKRETADKINDVARRLNLRVRFVDSIAQGQADGQYSQGEVLIEKGSVRPEIRIYGHEVGHSLEEMAPEEYQVLRAFVEQEHQDAINYRMAEYQTVGADLDYDGVLREFVNDEIGRLMENTEVLDTFIAENRENRTLLQRLADAFRALWNKLTGKDRVEVKNAEEALLAALREGERRGTAAEKKGRTVDWQSQTQKNAANNGDESKFSLKGEVEEKKGLVAIHNLTEEKLEKTLALGGFPMPSIAVTKAEIPHSNFGEISLVMDKSAIDPKADARNAVYSADAWTPTFPRTEYDVNREAESRVKSRLDGLSKQVNEMFERDIHGVSFGLEHLLNQHGGENGLVDYAKEKYGLKAAYLEENGTHIEPVTTQQEAKKGYRPERSDKYEKVVEVLGTNDPDTIGSMSMKEIRDGFGAKLEEVFPGITESALKMGAILRQVQAYLRDDGSGATYETVTDVDATRRAVDEAINQEEYERWVRELYSGIEANRGVYNNKERYDQKGNLRSFRETHYPVTLEGIVKAMASENDGHSKNVAGFYGAKSIRAELAERMGSIEEMHQKEGRLKNLSEAEANGIITELQDRTYALMSEIRDAAGYKQENELIQMDSIGEIMIEIVQEGDYSGEGIKRTFEKYRYNITDEVANEIQRLFADIAEMPVNMFEAKPERAVGFGEVLCAVVPEGTSERLIGQMKDAGVRQVVTYEAGNETDRLAKVNSVEGAKFSLKGEKGRIAQLERENESLRRRYEQATKQTKRSEVGKVSEEKVKRYAKMLMEHVGVKGDYKALALKLQNMYDAVASGHDIDGEEYTYYDFRDAANEIAEDMVRNAVYADTTVYEDYAELRSEIRETRILVDEDTKADIPDYNDFRKRNFGRLRLANAEKGGRKYGNVDMVYNDLAARFPEMFDRELPYGGDQLLRIAEVMQMISEKKEYNPWKGQMEEATRAFASEIMEEYWNLPGEKPTYADRAYRQREEMRRRNMERVKEAVNAERERGKEQQQKLKDWYKERDTATRERKAESEARNRLLRIAARMKRMPTNNTNKELIKSLIGDLYTEARHLTGTKKDELTALRQFVHEKTTEGSAAYDPNFVVDDSVRKVLNNLEFREIDDMTLQDVKDLTNVLLNLEKEIRDSKRLLGQEENRGVYEAAEQVQKELRESGGKEDGGINKYMAETLSPIRMMKRMAGYAKNSMFVKLGEDLADGQRKMMDYQMKAEAPFKRFAENAEFVKRFSGKDADLVTVTGMKKGKMVEVKITPAMRVSLWLHSQNTQNMLHMRDGGVTIPDMELYQKGKYDKAYQAENTIKISPETAKSMWGQMSETEREFAREVQRYFKEVSQPAINEVSNELKGIDIATVEDYFPIQTDTSFSHKEFEALTYNGTIESMGWLKDRVVHATNPIMLRGADDVLKQSIRMHGKYVGLAVPVRNFGKVWNVQTPIEVEVEEEGQKVKKWESFGDSTKKAMKNAWGETGERYIEKLMKDLQNGRHEEDVTGKVLNKVRSNYAGAVLTLNGSVAIKQAASYPTAAAVLGWKPLARAMADNGRVDLDLIAKYTPLQWYRSQGYSTKELGDMAAMDKQLPAMLNWVQGMDLLTTRKLWKASEYYVRDNNKALDIGSDGYYREVAKIYNRVIEETQPNYTTMERPQILRSESSLTQAIMMFKTQPLQNFNILYDAVREYFAVKEMVKKSTATKEDLAAARKNMGLAVTSQLGQLAVFAGMTAAWALFRGKTDKYEDEDGKVDLLSPEFWKGFFMDMANGTASMVPFGAEAWEVADRMIFGGKYYGVEPVSTEAINNAITSVGQLSDLVRDTMKTIKAGENVDWKSWGYQLDDTFDDVSKMAGIPYENVVNLFNACARNVLMAMKGEYMGEYIAMHLTMNPDKDKGEYMDLLWRASKENAEEYKKLYDKMLEDGFEEKEIKTAMESRMKKEHGVKKVSELSERYISPTYEDEYDEAMKRLQNGRVWGRATQEQRDKATDIVYGLTMGTDEETKEKLEKAGIDEGTWALYKLALEVVDKPSKNGKMGSYTNAEVEEAIEQVPNLSDRERAALWDLQGKNKKSNPWK